MLSGLVREKLRKNSDVSVIRIKTSETGSFLKNCLDAFKQKRVKLEEVPAIREFDMLFLCSPVWAFDIAPAMRSFMEVSDMKGKKVFLLLTYGSGKGKERAMDIFAKLAADRGAELAGRGWIKGKRVNEEFSDIQGGIEKCLKEFQQTRLPGQ